jgi:hypothetical protein
MAVAAWLERHQGFGVARGDSRHAVPERLREPLFAEHRCDRTTGKVVVTRAVRHRQVAQCALRLPRVGVVPHGRPWPGRASAHVQRPGSRQPAIRTPTCEPLLTLRMIVRSSILSSAMEGLSTRPPRRPRDISRPPPIPRTPVNGPFLDVAAT